MGVPAKRPSQSKSKRRKSQIHLHMAGMIPCPSCKKLTIPHAACVWCGMYNGRLIKTPKTPSSKKK